MNRYLLFFSIIFPSALFAVYAPIPEIERGTLLRVGIEAGVGYDDNLFGSQTNELDSVVYTFSPEVDLNLAIGDQGFFSSSYQLDASYYEDRPTEDKLYNHTFEVGLDYTFSERFNFSIEDKLTSVDNPESSLVLGTTNLQSNQSFWANDLIVAGNYALTEKFGLALKSQFYGVNYDDDTLARIIDHRKSGLRIAGRYLFTPKLTLVGSIKGQSVTYDVADSFKGSDSIFVLGGFDYNYSEKLAMQFRAGLESRDRNTGKDPDSFYGDFILVYSYSENSAVTLGLNHQLREVSNTSNFLDAQATSLNLIVQHDLTGNNMLFLTGIVSYERSTLEGRSQILDNNGGVNITLSQSDVDEDTLRLGLALVYNYKENLQFILDYDYDDISSDELAREQTRSRVSLSVKYSFGAIQ